MTKKERDAISDRERIKLYIESTIRRACDEITDTKEKSATMLIAVHDEMLKLSEIYKNMGFDKEVVRNDD